MKNDCLREKAAMHGEAALSDVELLRVFLGCGESAAVSLLDRFQNLRNLESASVGELRSVKGIGGATALKLKVALEMGRRSRQVALRSGAVLNSSWQVFAHFRERLTDEKKERFFSLILDCKHRVVREELVSVGTLNFSVVHPREVFGPAIRESAESIVLVHNHPSGDPTPSCEDIQVTRRLVEVGKIVGIDILDHIVIGADCFVSFSEKRLL